MPSLSNRLKSLGVKFGAEKPQPGERARYPIETVVEGEIRSTHLGETFVVETVYPLNHPHGETSLNLTGSMELVAAWAGETCISNCKPENFAFLEGGSLVAVRNHSGNLL